MDRAAIVNLLLLRFSLPVVGVGRDHRVRTAVLPGGALGGDGQAGAQVPGTPWVQGLSVGGRGGGGRRHQRGKGDLSCLWPQKDPGVVVAFDVCGDETSFPLYDDGAPSAKGALDRSPDQTNLVGTFLTYFT